MPEKSRPSDKMDRHAAADRLDEVFARSKPLPEDVGRSEEECLGWDMKQAFINVSDTRQEASSK